ncbi:MAG TPA: fibronectin type III domain-containing protein [Candidatus Acidoferrales bacterium]|nr:fibronectin type III domain-containing protein [Candidatus Acidoferrales bacterium]
MEIGIGAPPRELSKNSCANRNRFLYVAFLISLALAGCAAPSEPTERKPAVPQAVADLSATQTANSVALTFTLPTETVDQRTLKEMPTIEIYRGLGGPAADSGAHMILLATIPSAAVNQYVAQGQARYVDQLKPEDFAQRDSIGASYTVRTRASEKKDSEPSNVAYLLIRPALDPIADLKTQVTKPAVILSWSAPQKTLTGSSPPVAGYRIYRAESEPQAAGNVSGPKLKSPLAKIGGSDSPSFQDTQFEFGKTYAYSVRSITESGTEAVESADSNLAIVTPRDVFPPAAPQGLVVALVPAQAGAPAVLELSWAVSPETDIAGYNVYKSEEAGTPGTRTNADLLLTPAFRDMNVQPGHRYFYTVTAVDHSGNESPRSEAIPGGVPAESQSNP